MVVSEMILSQAGYIQRILKLARVACKRSQPEELHSFSLTYDEVLSLIGRQQNRCALSGMSLEYTVELPNAMVFDRLDPAGPWVLENTHLICRWVRDAKRSMSNLAFKQLLLELRGCLQDQLIDVQYKSQTVISAVTRVVLDGVLTWLLNNYWCSAWAVHNYGYTGIIIHCEETVIPESAAVRVIVLGDFVKLSVVQAGPNSYDSSEREFKFLLSDSDCFVKLFGQLRAALDALCSVGEK